MGLTNSEKKRLLSKYASWACVTGASSGIGEAMARELAEAGFNLVLIARRQSLLEILAAELEQRHKVKTVILATDLSEPQQLAEACSRMEDLDVGLFVAAAGFGTSGLFPDGDLVQELNMLQLNCAAVMHMTHYFCRRFRERGSGGIVLFSSIVAFQGVPYAAHYAATKAYIQTLAEALRVEMKPFGVDVLAAAPGPVKSGFEERADMKMDLALAPQQVAAPILRALGRRTTSYPGLLTKFLTYSLKMTPRFGKVKIMTRVMGGMTRHQRPGK